YCSDALTYEILSQGKRPLSLKWNHFKRIPFGYKTMLLGPHAVRPTAELRKRATSPSNITKTVGSPDQNMLGSRTAAPAEANNKVDRSRPIFSPLVQIFQHLRLTASPTWFLITTVSGAAFAISVPASSAPDLIPSPLQASWLSFSIPRYFCNNWARMA